ncbi:glutamate synthase-related protein, partial [Patescibacteria group bacterium AH-259-L07]|nr:glutamate synthase-related protein [Patescibacteria group bacterium AH-259-L07]
YSIKTKTTPEIVKKPPRFRVRVKKFRLIIMILKELFHLKFKFRVALDRPCIYGVFSRPVGGLLPREDLCVGCMRCTIQYPDVVQIHPHQKHQRRGDSYIKPEFVTTILYEARTGRVPVSGAGYGGPFGGHGWDGIWLDMSEIVRPTRDGIHGREFISTQVDIGAKAPFLTFDKNNHVTSQIPKTISISVPFLFDLTAPPVQSKKLLQIFTQAANSIKTLAILPLRSVIKYSLKERNIVPLISHKDLKLIDRLSSAPKMVYLDGWSKQAYQTLQHQFPKSIICVRAPFDTDILKFINSGVRVFHLTANYRGHVGKRFIVDLITEIHQRLVDKGMREEVTLIGSGGIVMAEHVPKAIICGLDAVALETCLWVGLQARFNGDCLDQKTASVVFPRLKKDWGIQRLKNLSASWHDQLLEVLGAMGMREIRRLRGEIGRAMFQKDLEKETFEKIKGYKK